MDGAADSGATARTHSQHIAVPSIPGLYTFAGSILIAAAELAGWYGDSQTALFLFPFAAAFVGDGKEDLSNIPADREIMSIPGCSAHIRGREFVRACGVRS